jgi:uncharacterized protein YigE (DUF2233 family)
MRRACLAPGLVAALPGTLPAALSGTLLASLLAMLLTASVARAVDCEALTHAGNRYTVCTVDPAREELRLFLRAPGGEVFGDFAALDAALSARGERLAFAMNGGMYHDDRAPVGHYIEEGREAMRVIAAPGPGNFGLLPNGILCIEAARARVIETRDYLEQRPACRFATQSGPMLVIDGALHPRFLEDSSSRYVRNGVGTSADGSRAVFAISETAVTFHEFASLFREALGLPDALFLDGNVSRLHAPALGRSDSGRRMGPIVGVTEQLGG